MKKILIAIIAIVITFNSFACPICGCGGGNLYMGLMPDFKRQFIGFRYNYSEYHTQLAKDITQHSNNYYNSIELWGGYNINRKLRVMAFAPYYTNKQIDDDGTTNTKGLGDISVMAQYNICQSITPLNNNKAIKQQLWIGGGLKVPTGTFAIGDTSIADINAQIGTGSTDFILNGQYNLQYGRFGVNANANYKMNTENTDKYQYGNKFSSNLLAFYHLGNGHLAISPNVGLGYEETSANKLQREKIQYTGSHLVTAIAGVELNYKAIGFGVNVQLPTSQDFAEGQTELRMKAMAHLSYSF